MFRRALSLILCLCVVLSGMPACSIALAEDVPYIEEVWVEETAIEQEPAAEPEQATEPEPETGDEPEEEAAEIPVQQEAPQEETPDEETEEITVTENDEETLDLIQSIVDTMANDFPETIEFVGGEVDHFRGIELIPMAQGARSAVEEISIAYLTCDQPCLTIGKPANFTIAVTGSAAQYTLRARLYRQSLSDTGNSYSSASDVATVTVPHGGTGTVTFTPESEGRYIVQVSVVDADSTECVLFQSAKYETATVVNAESDTVETKIAKIIAEVITSGMSDYEKALALHDWLIYNASYSYDGDHAHDAAGVLLDGYGVCESYTLAYQMLLTKVGVESIYVSGSANSGSGYGAHAWNLVKMNGGWYHVDCTWDDPVGDGYESHAYFGLSDAEMALDHKWETKVPGSSSNVHEDGMASADVNFSDYSELAAKTAAAFAADKRTYTFYYTGENAAIDKTAFASAVQGINWAALYSSDLSYSYTVAGKNATVTITLPTDPTPTPKPTRTPTPTPAPCTHPAGKTINSWYVKTGAASDNGDGTHTAIGDAYEDGYCPDCGETWTKKLVLSGVSYKQAHNYTNNVCSVCNSINVCQHTNIQTEQYAEQIGTPADNGDGTHTVTSNLYEESWCSDCGTAWDETLVQSGVTSVEAHVYSGNGVCACGASSMSLAAPVLTSVRHTSTDGKITLKWESETAAESYVVYEVGQSKAVATVTTTSVTLSKVAMGEHTYYVVPRIKVNDAWVEGAESNRMSLKVQSQAWRKAPTISSISQSTTDEGLVKLAWKPVSVAEAYEIAELKSGSKQVVAVTTSTSITLTGVSAGKHTYYVRPRQADSNDVLDYGSYSKEKAITVSTLWKKQPTISSVKQLTSADGLIQVSIKAGWSKTPAYAIYVDGKTKDEWHVDGGAATITAKISGVSAGTRKITVKPAKRNEATGAWSYGTTSAAKSLTLSTLWKKQPTITSVKQLTSGEGLVQVAIKAGWSKTPAYQIYVDGKTKDEWRVEGGAATVTAAISGVSAGTRKITVKPAKQSETSGSWSTGTASAEKKLNVVAYWKKQPTISSVKQTANGEVTIRWKSGSSLTRGFAIWDTVNKKAAQVAADFIENIEYDPASKLYTMVLTGVASGAHSYDVRPAQYSESKGTWSTGTASAAKALTVKTNSWQTAPTLSAKQLTDTEGVVRLTWTQLVPADGFRIYEVVKSGNKTTNKTVADVEGEMEYDVTGVSAGTHTYFVRPKQYDEATGVWKYGPSTSYSAKVAVTVKTMWNAKPTGLTAKQETDAEGKVTLTWKAGSYVTEGYQIWDTFNKKATKVAEVTDGSCTVTLKNVKAGAHSYTVRPGKRNASGTMTYGAASTASAAKTLTVATLWNKKPTSLTAKLSAQEDGVVTLTWKAGSALTDGYQVVDTFNKKATTVATVTDGSCTVTLKNVKDGAHSYVVRPGTYSESTKKWTWGTASANVSAAKKLTVTTRWNKKPTSLTAKQETNAEGVVTLTWKAGSSLTDGYQVYDTVGTKTTKVATVTDGSCTATIKNVAAGAHSYTVRPGTYNESANKWTWGTAANASAAKKLTVATLWSKQPTITSAAQTGTGEVTITWKTASALTPAFAVYDTVNKKTTTVLTAAQFAEQYAIEKANGETNYTLVLTGVKAGAHSYTVKAAKNSSGKWSYGAASAAKAVTVKSTAWTQAPTVKATIPAFGQVRLTWTQLEDAQAWQVYEVIGGVYTEIGMLTNAKSALLTDVSAGTHSYIVRPAQKDDSDVWQYGTMSKLVSVTMKDTAEAKVTGVQVRYENGATTVSWNAVPYASAYNVYAVPTTIVYSDSGLEACRIAVTESPAQTSVTVPVMYSGEIAFIVIPVFDGVEDTAYASDGVTVVYGEGIALTSAAYSHEERGVVLTWERPEYDDVTGYVLYRNDEPIATLGSADTTYVDTHVEAGETFVYAIDVLRECGIDNGVTPDKAVNAEVPMPQAPQNLKITYNGSAHTLTWDEVPGADLYEIWCSVESAEAELIGTTNAPQAMTFAGDRTAAYGYTVKAQTTIGGKTYTSEGCAMQIVQHGEAAEFTDLQYDAAQGAIVLTWEKPARTYEPVTAYVICDMYTGEELARIENADTTSWTHTGVKLGNMYGYSITTLYGENVSLANGTWRMMLGYLGQVTNLNGWYGGDFIDLNWDEVVNAQGYEIYCAVNGGEYELIATVSDTNYEDRIHENTNYSYKVQAYVKYADGTVSRGTAAVVTAEVGEAPVLNARYSLRDGGVVLTWNASNAPRVSGYNIHRGEAGGHMTLYEHVEAGVTTFVDTNVVEGTEYRYMIVTTREVTAGFAYGEDGPSETVTVTPDTLKPVTNLQATYEDEKTFLTWDLATGADYYEIIRDYEFIGDTWNDPFTPEINTFTDEAVEDLTAEYLYQIVSAVVTNTIKPDGTPLLMFSGKTDIRVSRGPKPVVNEPVLTKGGVSVSWKAVNSDKLRGYKVMRGDEVIAELTQETSVTDTTAASGATYTYKVIAVYTDGTMSAAATYTVPAFALEYAERSDGGVTITGCLGTPDAQLVIPQTIGGKTVKAIGESAFEGNTVITSVKMPNAVEVIGAKAFKNCTNLSSMICY